MRAVHPHIRIQTRIAGRAFEVRTVRAVRDQRLSRAVAQLPRGGEIGEIPVIVGRSDKQRVRPFQRVRHLLCGGLRGNAPRDGLLHGDRVQSEDLAGVEHASVRVRGNGDAAPARAAERVEHGKDPAGAAVRQKKARVCAENVRDLPLRLRQNARRGEQVIRIGKFGDVRARALMPGRMKGDMLFLRAEHPCDAAGAQNGALHAPYSSYSQRRKVIGS